MSHARCAGCDIPVDEVGQTCSLSCYTHMVGRIGFDMTVTEVLDSMEIQPWYEAEQDRIAKMAEQHEVEDELATWFGSDEGNEYYD